MNERLRTNPHREKAVYEGEGGGCFPALAV
jgi:hypothetical protein